MRRFLVIAAWVALVAGCAVAQELTIGIDLSTTGPIAAIGIPQKNGILLTERPTIAGLKVKYVYFDDASDPTIAVQNVKRMISENNIDMLIGPTGTSTSL